MIAAIHKCFGEYIIYYEPLFHEGQIHTQGKAKRNPRCFTYLLKTVNIKQTHSNLMEKRQKTRVLDMNLFQNVFQNYYEKSLSRWIKSCQHPMQKACWELKAQQVCLFARICNNWREIQHEQQTFSRLLYSEVKFYSSKSSNRTKICIKRTQK